ncbi:uncharacterized protein ACHE_50333A [Aspergillus chevalieri]|uniref:Uncharacterized protein n=1 Tax=Aspergillus chevalieri TaxID=182096 RepID=A0A7R7ZNR1_ASPCH|nr:uncharacterized protein ACHE_50333A [Aspergillus chevalieri]BCR89135.1 hypothetical protein ACHE_50333A [Aspergillus chevalieri]
MSSPSVVFNRGLRCAKVKRVSIPVSVPSASPGPLSPLASTSFPLLATPSPQASSALSGAYSTPSTFSIRPSTLLGPPEKIHPTISLTPEVQVTSPPNVGVLPPTPVASATSSTGSKTETDTSTPTVDSRVFGASHSASSSISTTPSATTTAGTGSVGDSSTQKTDGSNKDNLPRVIVGSILGVLGFIAFVALICFLLLRRRRRMYGDTKSLSSNGKLSRIDRSSVPTLTSWEPRHRSVFSFHSPPSGQSPPNRLQPTPTPELTPPKPTLFHNPFSKSTEACIEAQLDHRGTPPNPFADPTFQNNNKNTRLSPTWKQVRLSKPNIIEWQPQGQNSLVTPRSLYGSDHSLGSTIILPGRNSSVGSLQVINYRLSSPSATSPRIIDLSTRRVSAKSARSARSDPFDLEVPMDAVHTRA